jgi:hypothetical protein
MPIKSGYHQVSHAIPDWVKIMQKKPSYRAIYLEDVLNALEEMEATFAELESNDVFQAFNTREKVQYRDGSADYVI